MKFYWFDLEHLHHYCVYCLTSPEGLRYFGISRYSGKRRWKSGNGYKGNTRLNRDIQTWGFASFQKEILAENCYRDDAERMEAQLIAEYETTDPTKGYNVRSGDVRQDYNVYLMTFPDGKRYVGMTGGSVAERMDYGSGYRHNKALYAAIREAGGLKNVKVESFSYPLTRDSAERIESTLIRYFGTNDPEKGYNRGGGALSETGWTHSDEVKSAIRSSLTGRKASEETKRRMHDAQEKKPVICLDTGERFDSVRQAAERFGTAPSGITRACEGKQKTCAGQHWQYGEKE